MLTRKSARQAARECGGQIQRTKDGFIVKTESVFLVKGYHRVFVARAKRFNTEQAAGRYATWLKANDFYEIEILRE